MGDNRQVSENEVIGYVPNAVRVTPSGSQPGPGGDGPGSNGDLVAEGVNFQQRPFIEGEQQAVVDSDQDIFVLLRQIYPFRILCLLIRSYPHQIQQFMEYLDNLHPQLAQQIRDNYQVFQDLINEYSNPDEEQHQGVLQQQLQQATAGLNGYGIGDNGLRLDINQNVIVAAADGQEEGAPEQYLLWAAREISLSLRNITREINTEPVIDLDHTVVEQNGAQQEYQLVQNYLEIRTDDARVIDGEEDDEDDEEHMELAEDESDQVEENTNRSYSNWETTDEVVDIGEEETRNELIESEVQGKKHYNLIYKANPIIKGYDIRSAALLHNDHTYAAGVPNTTIKKNQNNSNKLVLNCTVADMASTLLTQQLLTPLSQSTQSLESVPGENGMLTTTTTTITTSYAEVAAGIQSFATYSANENLIDSKSNTDEDYRQDYTELLPTMSDTDKASIGRLCELGFPEEMAIQAYYACHRNEATAANFLLSYL